MSRRRTRRYRPRPLPRPTAHAPGTEGKILALRDRVTAKKLLWHPLDAPMDGEATVRVPVLDIDGNRQICGWDQMDERAYLRRLAELEEGEMDAAA